MITLDDLNFLKLFKLIIIRIYVGHLADSVSELDLEDLFEQYRRVEDVQLIVDRETGQSRGFAFVEMENDNEGDEAIEELSYREFKWDMICLNAVHSRNPRGDRRGYGNLRL